jgi:cyclopropane-fatty-acyl-phospholipid synthase
MTPPGTTGPFIRKYIFPGVYTPSLSEVFAATERVGLWVADTEVLRRHYDYTLQHWRDRFAANRTQAVAIAGERFCRMWEYYLAAVQVGFRNGSNMVFQLLLSNRIESVPIARDSMMVGAKTAGTPNRRAAASDGAAMCEIAAKAEKFRQRAVAREAEIKSAS